MAKIAVSIRDMDERTWRSAVIAAMKAGKTVAEFVGEAITEKLNRKKGETK